jgi:hypothetical protein
MSIRIALSLSASHIGVLDVEEFVKWMSGKWADRMVR